MLFEGAQQQALGVRVEQVLESAYWSIGKTLNSYPSDTLMVVLYTNKQFQDVTRAPAWAGGEFDGRIRLAVGGAMRTPGALDRVVRHELVHAIIQHAAPRNVPTWVNEGLASVLESTDRTWVRRVLSESREIFPLEDLADGFAHLDGREALVAYAESAVAAQILTERLGPNLGLFLQMVGSGHTVDQALGTLNVRPDAFYAEWRKRVGVRSVAVRCPRVRGSGVRGFGGSAIGALGVAPEAVRHARDQFPPDLLPSCKSSPALESPSLPLRAPGCRERAATRGADRGTPTVMIPRCASGS